MRDPRIGCAGPQRSVNLLEAEPALRGQDLAGVEIWRPVVDPESRWAGRRPAECAQGAQRPGAGDRESVWAARREYPAAHGRAATVDSVTAVGHRCQSLVIVAGGQGLPDQVRCARRAIAAIPAFGTDAPQRERLAVRHRLELPFGQLSDLAAVERGRGLRSG